MRPMFYLALLGAAAGFQAGCGGRAPTAGRIPLASTAPLVAAGRAPSAVMEEEGVRAGLVTEVPFEVRFSIGNLITISGGVLLIYSIGAYLLNNGQTDLIQTLGFVYAVPATLGGLALKYAELPPVPVKTSPQAEALRESKGTKVLKKIFSDATRFTYGDAHMEEPLKALKLAPRGMGPPTLIGLKEAVSPAGGYALSMVFEARNTPYRVWKDRAPRYARFFGPGVRAELRKVSSVDRTVELTLITMEPGEEDKPLERLEGGTTAPILSATEEERRAKEQMAAAAAAAADAAAADAAPVDAVADA